jgi:hypothetical protein
VLQRHCVGQNHHANHGVEAPPRKPFWAGKYISRNDQNVRFRNRQKMQNTMWKRSYSTFPCLVVH